MESVTQGYYGFAQQDQTWAPDVNLYETETAYRVCVDLAGVEKDKIELTVAEQMLTVRGERPVPRSPAAAGRGRRGCGSTAWKSTTAPSPARSSCRRDVDHEAISATYRNGLLWIELPKTALNTPAARASRAGGGGRQYAMGFSDAGGSSARPPRPSRASDVGSGTAVKKTLSSPKISPKVVLSPLRTISTLVKGVVLVKPRKPLAPPVR